MYETDIDDRLSVRVALRQVNSKALPRFPYIRLVNHRLSLLTHMAMQLLNFLLSKGSKLSGEPTALPDPF